MFVFPAANGAPLYSLIIPVRRPPERFRDHIEQVYQFFAAHQYFPFEIILVPNSGKRDQTDPAHAWCAEMAAQWVGVRSVPHLGLPGKGAALKTGVRVAQGKYVLMTDADLPYGLEFFEQAMPLLEQGVSLVAGNRRSPKSWFEVPVPLLRYVYGRHRKSLTFNRLVRWLLPISIEDTQAGIKAMTRQLAQASFLRDLCPGFLFDLEIFLIANSHGLQTADLPVRFTQHDDVTTVNFVRLSFSALYWLARIKVRHLLGHYRRPLPVAPQAEAALETR
jgi:dolichyl-phosphate beta-glucosyltransferase